jgi:ribonuclease D
MHGADYDLRLLRKHHDFVPGKLFDTMLAARLLGVGEFGLSNLVERFVGVKLEKGSQKANWARRPLTEKMEDYARNDTHYLKPLVDMLRTELQSLGRLEWHAESCERLIEECSAPPSPRDEEAWRIKGSSKLDRQAQAVLREIWRWREQQALTANRPPFHVLSSEAMVGLSEAAIRHQGEVRLPHHLSPTRSTSILAAIRHALSLPPEQWPVLPRTPGRRLSDAQVKRSDAIKAVRDRNAARLGIDPSLIAPRAALLDLAHDWDSAAAKLMKWQVELLKR